MTTADKHRRTGRRLAANGPPRPPGNAVPLEERPATIRTHNKPRKPRRRRVPETSAHQQVKQKFRLGAPSRAPQLTCRIIHNRIRCSNGHDGRRCRISLCIKARVVGLRSDAP
jgi:hypothetical protein